MTYWYAGDTVASTVPLKLSVGDPSPTVSVGVDRVAQPAGPLRLDSYVFRGVMDGAWWFLGRDDGDDRWRFSAGGGVWGSISDDLGTISVTALDAAPERWLAEVITNWILSFRLALAGRWCFHGSVVVRPSDGAAVAILGHSGAGKTTTAVACQQLGAEVIADDLVAGVFDDRGVVVQSTSSNLKLRLEAASGVLPHRAGDDADFADRVDVATAGVTRSARLARICFIDRATGSGAVEQVSAATAARRMMEFSKLVAWADVDYLEREFGAACEIAGKVEAVTADVVDLSGGITAAARWSLLELLGR